VVAAILQFCEVAPDVVLVDLRLRDITVAVDHYNLREADAETKILQTTIADLERGYEITNNRSHRGLIGEQ